MKVATNGDDAAAAAACGATAFRNVQAAIDFAAANPSVASSVCVAGGASCSASAAYGDVSMKNGISVRGNYESTGWTRCSARTTELRPTVPRGVYFGPDVVSATVLDGFDVHAPTTAPEAAVTIDGARGVTLQSVRVEAPSSPRGVIVRNGASAALRDGRITYGPQAVGLGVASSDVLVEDVQILTQSIAQTLPNPAYAVLLDDAAGSRIVSSDLLGRGGGAVAAIRVVGDATDVHIQNNIIQAMNGSVETVGISLEACGGAMPLIDGNVSIGASSTLATPVIAIRSLGDCHPIIQSNTFISASGVVQADDVTAIRCGSSANVASRCLIEDNRIENDIEQPPSPGHVGATTGIDCDDGGCEAISNNVVNAQSALGCNRSCSTTGIGIRLDATDTLVDANTVTAGCAVGRATGVHIEGGNPRVQNNRVTGSRLSSCISPGPNGPAAVTVYGVHLASSSSADVHSNTVEAGGRQDTPCSGGAIGLSESGGTFRNNLLLQGACLAGYHLVETGANADPSIFQNNDFSPPLTYWNENFTLLTTPAAVNALSDMTVSGTLALAPLFSSDPHLSSASPLIDAGIATGAPARDIDGETRTSPPDIGADEWSAANDPCFGVCANGTCSVVNGSPQCTCAMGYEHPPGQPLVCQDIDECSTDNGSCDPLTSCTNTPGGRTCGPCPTGYSGTGETGCTLIEYCSPNPCQNGAACFEVPGDFACACPPGITGHDCSEEFEEITAGEGSTCGRRADGSVACWGNQAGPQSTIAFTTVAQGSGFGCGIEQTTGALSCWGANDQGQATPPSGTFQAVSAGQTHACAIRTNGTVACWGNPSDDRTTPPDGEFQTISCGTRHSCGIRPGGALECWGFNGNDRATPPTGMYQSVAVWNHSCAVDSITGVPTCWGLFNATPPSGTYTSVIVGSGYACALTTAGAIACWGSSATPPTTGTFESLAGAAVHACALATDGSVACWGTDSFGQASPPGGAFRAIASEQNAACAIGGDQSVVCWGFQFALPSGTFSSVGLGQQYACGVRTTGALTCWGSPLPALPSGTFQAVDMGSTYGCGLQTDGSVACFGTSLTSQPEPGSLFESVSAGAQRACGVRTTGAVECWGPGAPSFSGTYDAVSVGPNHACAVQTNGNVECVGANESGQSTPLPGPFTSVTVGSNHTCALRPDGTIGCWGSNTSGQSNAPSGVFSSLSAGNTHTCAVRPDLTVTCWGSFVR